MPLQVRRGTETQRTAMTEPLASGELLYVTNTGTLYIGNGTAIGGIPVANLSEGGVRNIAADLFTSGTHTGGISFTYDGTNVNAALDIELANYAGTIRADAFEGSVFPDDSSLGGEPLVDAIRASINLNGTVKGNIIPDANSAYDIGSTSLKFKDLYLSGTSLYLGNAVITASGSAVQLPAGSTVGGVAIGTGTGTGDGVIEGSSYRINIVSSDGSTIMLNNDNEVITASGGFVGPLTGNVLGDVTGDVTGDLYSSEIYVPDTSFGLTLHSKKNSSFSVSYYEGTNTARTPILAGDNVGSIAIKGWNGALDTFSGGIGSSWDALADTTDDAPLSSVALISGAGGSNFNYAIFDSSGKLTANVFKSAVYSVAGTPLPAASTAGAGARAFVSDANATTFAAVYVGSSTNNVPVYSDGTNWRIG